MDGAAVESEHRAGGRGEQSLSLQMAHWGVCATAFWLTAVLTRDFAKAKVDIFCKSMLLYS